MTKEETLAYIKAYLNGDTAIGNIIQLRSVLESAVTYLSKSPLPSDTDEAARHYLLNEHCSPLNVIMHQADIKAEMTYHKDIESAFKAGAEWMAGRTDEKPHILLTEDILEKNGFKPDNDSVLSWSLQDDLDDTVLKLFKISNAFVLPTVGMTIAIQYVHELQMLFELCGMKQQIKI